eukprot:scaffold1938_cov399-Prasinococcus_capsulatus_cf.AAC.32
MSPAPQGTKRRRREAAPGADAGAEPPLTGMRTEKTRAALRAVCRPAEWLLEYREARPGAKKLQAQVDSFMAEYDRREQEALLAQEAAAAGPDDEGWTVVGKKRSIGNKGLVVNALPSSKAATMKKKEKTNDSLKDFYRFQLREQRRNGAWMKTSVHPTAADTILPPSTDGIVAS